VTIVVTGLGFVTPYGTEVDEIRRRWAAAESVATPPPDDERPALAQPWVARVPASFDPGAWVRRRKDLKLMARANVLASAAAQTAVREAGLEGSPRLVDAGLFVAVGQEPGNMDDVLTTVAASRDADRVDLERLSNEGMRQMNPLSSIKTLPNMSHAHVAIALGLQGPGMALCAGPAGGPRAAVEAMHALEAGRASICVVVAADAAIDFPDRVSAFRRGELDPVAEAAVAIVLETQASAEARGAVILGSAARLLDRVPGHAPFGRAGAAEALLSLAVQFTEAPTVPPAPRSARAPAVHVKSTPPPIAITGIGLRTPLGASTATFIERLIAGVSAVAPIQAFPRAGFPVQLACEVPDFDPDALPEALAAQMRGLHDRKGELAIAAALAAVADFGEALPPGAALIYGTGLSSVSLRELEEDCLPFLDAAGRFDYARFGLARPPVSPQAPRRHAVERPIDLVSAHLGLSGPRAHHFSACAAGAAALGHATDLLRRGEAEVALVGAADSMVHPFGLLPFILLGATTPNTDPATAARPFDQHRDGFVMGEAGVFYVLEPLARARAAGRRVYGLLLGHGTSSDAFNVTAPHPEGAGAERAMGRALADAGIGPGRVGYINAHGTGTALNDAIESQAIRRVFGASAPPVSSAKAQLGHTIAAAGAVELLACLAAFDTGRLPPNPNLRQVDARIDLDLVEQTSRAAVIEVAVSNSFGFGGQNAALVVGHPDAQGG
jgi:3-oxoacyl-[acyl-carrier-protein] synthase II